MLEIIKQSDCNEVFFIATKELSRRMGVFHTYVLLVAINKWKIGGNM